MLTQSGQRIWALICAWSASTFRESRSHSRATRSSTRQNACALAMISKIGFTRSNSPVNKSKCGCGTFASRFRSGGA